MRRRRRPVLWGLTAAATTTAAGLSVNILTDNQGSLVAWLAVAACTALAGVVPGLFAAGTAEPEIPLERLLIECTVGPDGITTINARAEGAQATQMLTEWLPSPALRGGSANGALPKPLPVALVTRSRATGTARRLAELERRCGGSNELDLRLCIDNRVEPRCEALRGAPVLVIDDRCSLDGTSLLVGGIDLAALGELHALAVILSCHDGAGTAHTDALRRSLRGPAAFLACTGSVPAEHLGVLYPLVLEGIGELAGARATPEELRSRMDGALARAQQSRPQLDWGRWAATVLTPEG
ncbi:hypothetical protein Acsp03_53580 [Actinomadura sp. NBRC 104412]|uniref:hypothetical protein n=1 Tax=Actinomadura sp. NBRC 104412 TaxID=3032203 RepID=UPI0024A1F6D4|nr:hypothetical protein [Actinomadura sp. NBRC 104412]GLZ07892.1 hypothetical protein Acsp03_53580 [Actinomadura sp. NBRC 104412]